MFDKQSSKAAQSRWLMCKNCFHLQIEIVLFFIGHENSIMLFTSHTMFAIKSLDVYFKQTKWVKTIQLFLLKTTKYKNQNNFKD